MSNFLVYGCMSSLFVCTYTSYDIAKNFNCQGNISQMIHLLNCFSAKLWFMTFHTNDMNRKDWEYLLPNFIQFAWQCWPMLIIKYFDTILEKSQVKIISTILFLWWYFKKIGLHWVLRLIARPRKCF